MTEVKCAHCSYKWTTKSDMIYVTCPNCGKKTSSQSQDHQEDRKEGTSMKRFMLSVSEEMYYELEKERKLALLASVQEVVRRIIANYLMDRNDKKSAPERRYKLLRS